MNNVFLLAKRKLPLNKTVKAIKTLPETHIEINDLLCLHINTTDNLRLKAQESLTVTKYLKKIKESHLLQDTILNRLHSNKTRAAFFSNKLLLNTSRLKSISTSPKGITPIIQLPQTSSNSLYQLSKDSLLKIANQQEKTSKGHLFSNEKILSSIMSSETKSDLAARRTLKSSGNGSCSDMMHSTVKQALMSELSLLNDRNEKDEEANCNQISPMLRMRPDCDKSQTASRFIMKPKMDKYKSLTDIRDRTKCLTNNCEFSFKKVYFPEIKRNCKAISDKKEEIKQVLTKISNHFQALKDTMN